MIPINDGDKNKNDDTDNHVNYDKDHNKNEDDIFPATTAVFDDNYELLI